MANSTYAFANTALVRVKARWQMLTGRPSEFSLEARFFHSMSLGVIFLASAYVPYDFFAGLPVAAFSCIFLVGIFCYEYYRSRFRNVPHSSFVFGIVGLLLFSVNYFFNGGLQGSTDLIWPVYLLLLLTICPYRHYLAWVLVYLIVFALVHLVAYLHPELVGQPFKTAKDQFIDRITVFPIPVITTSIVIGLFRRSYDRERVAVKQRDAEKSRLLSILSHDLRAPFIQIQQYLQLLGDASLSAADQLEMKNKLQQTNDQTMEMLTGLLYWSRSQLEGGVVHLAQLNLAETLGNTLAIANTLAGQKGIKLNSDIDPALRVTGDADMLQLVVRNLLQNAIKFTPLGGIINVEAARAGTSVRLNVSDNGMGMTPDQMAALFSGAKTPSFGTAGERGVGLGLLLCREFMERQNGQISAESAVGKGSKFVIGLPGADAGH